ncbi:19437_t:CDS:2, partial [Funneliformis geosporum]
MVTLTSKEAASFTSSSSTSTSVPTNPDLEIIQEVFGSLSNKKMEFETFNISKITTINKISTVILTSNNNNNSNINFDNTAEMSFSTKNRSKFLDPDKHFEDDDIEEDLKNFTVIAKAIPFAVTSNIKFTSKEKNNSKIILAINNIFAQNDNFKGISIYYINLMRSIDLFYDFTQYKPNMQFNERTIHVTDILLQMKPANIKQVFVKYETVTDFRMIVR